MSKFNFESSGYVLHSRRFRENSLLLDVFTQRYGRVALIARRSTAKKKISFNPYQSFNESYLRWRGKGDLQNLQSADSIESQTLRKNNLICGLYCNELLIKLTARHIPLEGLYLTYRDVVKDLAQAKQPETVLRQFESNLLAELGHAINFYDDYRTGDELAVAEQYFFHPRVGFSTLAIGEGELKISAAEMESLRHNDFSFQATAKLVKNLHARTCLLYTSPSPRDATLSRMPSSA